MFTPNKRPSTDENSTPVAFVQYSGPSTTKRVRRKVLHEVTPAVLNEARRSWVENQKHREAAEQLQLNQAEVEQEKGATQRLEAMDRARISAGYSTLHAYISELLKTKDRRISSQVSQMLMFHGNEILDSIHLRQPQQSDAWMYNRFQALLSEEGAQLAHVLQPDRTRGVSLILQQFSMNDLLKDAQKAAPNLFSFICSVTGYQENRQDASSVEGRKHKNVALGTIMCIVAQTRNEKANEFQLVTAIYLLASGASRTLFDVLNHAGFSLSYSSAMGKIKQLGQERLRKMRSLVREKACMVVWDNINIAFRVSEERQTSKNHFDNGTTATLIPLFDIPYGSIPLSVLPPRQTRRNIHLFKPHIDLLPTAKEITELQSCMIWHIGEILLNAYPELRRRLEDIDHIPPLVLVIPVHTTEQYPLPAALIDESTIDGTLDVINHIFFRTLELTEDEIKHHGPFLSGGDQLTNALTDTASSSRRDDKGLVDSPGKFMKTQVGLFHAKVAGSRCTANEHWGVPNSKSPWSLWRMNTLLGRKAISAGWKAKQLPPFRPIMELMLHIILPANVLDGFRLYCPGRDLDGWVSYMTTYQSIRDVAKHVFDNLFSAARVSKLQQQADRDIPLENIILFNRDSLILTTITAAIKRGDIGTVVNGLAHWMVMFRGSGKMPKYADALFHTLMDLKTMDPRLRHAFLMNWLANLSGKPNAFKEIDLLQEHQNFWLKVIYNAKGSNRSWEWLATVSVSIFALRDVIRQVQVHFQTPHNSKSHTSPSIEADIKVVKEYLELHKIQTYLPTRLNNEWATPARDLLVAGAVYATTPGAYRNFRIDKRCARYATSTNEVNQEVDKEEDADQCDFGNDAGLNLGDLSIDEEEFPSGIDPEQLVAFVHDSINALSEY